MLQKTLNSMVMQKSSILSFGKVWIGLVCIICLLASCGTDRHHFSLEGHFLKMNQGDFYIYSPDGAINGIDTITVQGGRFAYEIPCEDEGTIVIVLPNYSEIPVFVKPGGSVDMEADASHIKDVEVTGTDDNEKMTKWRKNCSSLSPDEQKKHAEQFIKDNPSSIISRWILRKYFIVNPKPDLKKAKQLVALMQKSTGENATLGRLSALLENTSLSVGDPLPKFSGKDLQNKDVQSSYYKNGTVVFVCWATWNFMSTNMTRELKSRIGQMKSQGKQVPKVLGISIDPSIAEAKRTLGPDSLSMWPTVCDGKMWDSPIVKALGFSNIPDNIIIENGKVKACHLSQEELLKQIDN